MKKLILLSSVILALLLAGCSGEKKEPRIIENKDGSISITRVDEDGKAIAYGKKVDGSMNPSSDTPTQKQAKTILFQSALQIIRTRTFILNSTAI